MITKEAIKIYTKYKGELDTFTRSGRKKEKQKISDEEWYKLDEIFQDLILIQNGLYSKTFEDKVRTFIKDNLEHEASQYVYEILDKNDSHW